MQVDVIDGLSRPRIHVEYRTVPLLMDVGLHCQFPGNLKHLAD
jgi:hypothetical protein